MKRMPRLGYSAILYRCRSSKQRHMLSGATIVRTSDRLRSPSARVFNAQTSSKGALSALSSTKQRPSFMARSRTMPALRLGAQPMHRGVPMELHRCLGVTSIQTILNPSRLLLTAVHNGSQGFTTGAGWSRLCVPLAG